MSWNPFKYRSARQQPKLRPIRKSALQFKELETRLAPAVNVLPFHNDIASTGQNLGETALSPTNVQVGSFGKLFATPLDGQVYAQPLVDTGVSITAGPQPGMHNVVFVATEHDTLYALDAGTGTILWQR